MKPKPTRDQLHFYLIFPNIFGFKGGEQVYSAFLLHALQQLHPDAHYSVFLKYDKPSHLRSHFLPHTQFHCFGQWTRPLQILLFACKILWLGIWQRPTLIITSHVNYSPVCFALHQLTGIPYWVVTHGLEIWNLKNRLRQIALHHAERVIAVSHYTRDRLLKEQSLEPARVAVLPNTFRGDRFQPGSKPTSLLKRYGLTVEQPIILTVGRLAHYKGYTQMLHALVDVRRHIPDVHYILAGKGGHTSIKALIKQLNLQNCVTLTGFVPDKELCDHYNLCNIFTMPSKGEGFGIVYLEALACGKPVLAGNQDGAIDPLAQGELGCLVDPDDVEAIAQALVQILQGTYPNPMIYQPARLRQTVLERYEFSQFCRVLSDLFHW